MADSSMDRLIDEIKAHLPEDIADKLPLANGREIILLLRTYSKFKMAEINAGDLLFESKVVMDRTWEMLNIGKWADVPVHYRQNYAIACLIHVIALLSDGKDDALKSSLTVTDMGILLGHPFEGVRLTEVAGLLAAQMSAKEGPKQKEARAQPEVVPSLSKKIKLDNEIATCSRPSLDLFYKNYFLKRKPVKLTDCIHHWPAFKLWPDLEYIKSKAGYRTVPIEIGKHYADVSYRQKLMKVSDFIDEYFRDDAADVGYLAQHQLFDQVPELRADIMEPEYCAVSEREEGATDADINAWLGPKGTVSPLHYDPKHNLLCQVVGSKRIILYPESDSEFLYPKEGLQKNTSRVDAENPDLNEFPDFAHAQPENCLLSPGEVLYIPPRYWHHVRALEDSFSVSFWWE